MKLYDTYKGYCYNIKDFDEWLQYTYMNMNYLNWQNCTDNIKADILFQFVRECTEMKVK